jgi:hypothetical protein
LVAGSLNDEDDPNVGPKAMLAEQLSYFRTVCGEPALDEIASRTAEGDYQHGRMERATVHDKISGRSSPSLDQVLAFHQACLTYAADRGHRPPADLADPEHWRRLWYDMRRSKQASGRRRRATRHESDNDTDSVVARDVPPHPPDEILRLPVLPLTSPDIDWANLNNGLATLGVKHVGHLFATESAPLIRVVDGVWVGVGSDWTPIDAEYLARTRGRLADRGVEDTDAVGGVIDSLAEIYADDRMGLRRLLLFQLAQLLSADSSQDSELAARRLGVDPTEAAVLAQAVSLHSPDLRLKGLEAMTALAKGDETLCINVLTALPRETDHGIDQLLIRLTTPGHRADQAIRTLLETPTPVHSLQASLHSTEFMMRLMWGPPSVGTLSLRVWPMHPPTQGVRIDGLHADYQDLLAAPSAQFGILPDSGMNYVEVVPPPGLYWITAVTESHNQAVIGRSLMVHIVRHVPAVVLQRTSERRATVFFPWPQGVDQMDVRWECDGWLQHRRVGSTGSSASFEIEVSATEGTVTVESVSRPGADVVLTARNVINFPAWASPSPAGGRRRRIVLPADHENPGWMER